MSHVATIETEVNDLKALKEACEELGLTFLEGKKTYKWYGRWVKDYHGKDAAYKHGIDPKDYGKCDHAIQVKKGGYEIGVVKKKDGGHVLVWDFYGGDVEEACGKGCQKLYTAYTKKVVTKSLKAKGFTLQKTDKTKNGETELIYVAY